MSPAYVHVRHLKLRHMNRVHPIQTLTVTVCEHIYIPNHTQCGISYPIVLSTIPRAGYVPVHIVNQLRDSYYSGFHTIYTVPHQNVDIRVLNKPTRKKIYSHEK
jgi:hypothetical protein